MLAIDIIMRFSAFGLLGSLAFITLRDHFNHRTGKLLVALCLSLMAMMISSAPEALDLPESVKRVARFIDLPNTVLAWLFVLSVMNDDFRLSTRYITLALIYCAIVWFLTLNVQMQWGIDERLLVLTVNLYALGLFLYLLMNVLKNRRDDLVEPRRRLRWFFVVAVIGLVGLAILSEILSGLIGDGIRKSFKIFITFILVLSGHYWFLQISDHHIAFAGKKNPSKPLTPHSSELTDKTRAKLAVLDKAMEIDKLWRDADLSLNKLARHIGVSPKRLRALINQNLGYRNFKAYLQSYRLKAAKEALSDATQRDVTILEIALDVGFNSTSTFNRVFKQAENISPKSYRSKSLAD
jgi:AraC-like DNA-binding protein